jgi:outer membrane protein, heavy metal efflux system
MPQLPSYLRSLCGTALLGGCLLSAGCTAPLLPDGWIPGMTDPVDKTGGTSTAPKPKGIGPSAPAMPALLEPDDPDRLPPDADSKPPEKTKAKAGESGKPKDAAKPKSLPAAAKPAAADSSATPPLKAETLPGDSGPMSIDDVLQFALDHHPVLRQRQNEVEIAQAKLVTAGLLPNPQLTFDTETPTSVSGDTQLSGRLMFTIPTGGKRRYGMQAARAGIQKAQMAVSAESELILIAAAETALEVLYLQELVELYGRLNDLAAQGAEIQKARFQLHAIPFTDKMIAESDAVDIGTRRLEAVARLESARIRLGRAIGMNPPRPVVMDGQLAVIPIPDVPLETLLAAARSNRPEVAAARSAITESQWQLALARAQAKPDIEIGPRGQTVVGKGDGTAGGRIQFDVPVFNRNQGGIAGYSALVRANCAGLEAAELRTLSDVAAAHAELMPLRVRLDYYEKQVVPLAANTEAMILEVYRNRAIEAVQVSELQQKFARMRLSHLELRYRYNQVLMRLELFLGQCLSDLPGAAKLPPDAPDLPRPGAIRPPAESDTPLDEPEILKTPPPPLPH